MFGVCCGLHVISVIYVIRDRAGIYAAIGRRSTISGSSNTNLVNYFYSPGLKFCRDSIGAIRFFLFEEDYHADKNHHLYRLQWRGKN